MKDHPIQLYLRLLGHPVSLAACTAMLINDFWLKQASPSWLSGKLSDLAGLFLLPFLVGACLSLVQRGLRLSDRATFGIAVFLPGMLYAGVKLSPLFAGFLNHYLAMRIVPDVTDLIALPALAGSVLLWRALRFASTPALRWQWAALPLILLTTLADMEAPNYGISSVHSECSNLYAESSTGVQFISSDSGITWQTSTSQDHTYSPLKDINLQVFEDKDRNTLYRITDSSSVAISTNGGDSWVNEPVDANLSQAEQTYIRLQGTGNPTIQPGILDAVFDPSSGNLILAMGHEGVLVRQPAGSYVWADVGPYMHQALMKAGFPGFFTLLVSSFLVALLSALLAMRTWASKRDSTTGQVTLTVLCWIIVLLTAALSLPGLFDYPPLAVTVPASAFGTGFLFLLGMNLLAASRMKGSTAWWTRLIPAALLTAGGMWLFYVLWYLNWIPYYWLAAVLSMAWFISAVVWQIVRLPKVVLSN